MRTGPRRRRLREIGRVGACAAGSFAGLASEAFGVGLGRGVVRECGGLVRVLTNEHL